MLFGTLNDIIYIQFLSLRWQPEAVSCHDGKIALVFMSTFTDTEKQNVEA